MLVPQRCALGHHVPQRVGVAPCHGQLSAGYTHGCLEALRQPPGQADVVGVVVCHHDLAQGAASDEGRCEHRLPHRAAGRGVDAGVDHGPTIGLWQHIDVDVVERKRQRQAQQVDACGQLVKDPRLDLYAVVLQRRQVIAPRPQRYADG